jgi:hypothetical protein
VQIAFLDIVLLWHAHSRFKADLSSAMSSTGSIPCSIRTVFLTVLYSSVVLNTEFQTRLSRERRNVYVSENKLNTLFVVVQKR